MFRQRIVFLTMLIMMIMVIILLAACRPTQKSGQALPPTPTRQPPPTATPTPTPLKAQVEQPADLGHFMPSDSFVLRFNQPMDTSRQGAALQFSPTIPGHLAWDATHTRLTFTSVTGFKQGQTYTVTLASDLASSSGARFDTPPQWHIYIPALPRVTNRQPAATSISERRPTIRVTFDRAMDHESVAAALKVKPAIPLNLRWQTQTLYIEPAQPFDPGARYDFALAKTAQDSSGLPLERDYTWYYKTSDLVASTTWPARKNSQTTPLVIRFNYPMDTTSVQKSLAVEPAVTGKLRWDEARTTLTLTPTVPLASSTRYTLSFEQQVKDANGNGCPLPKPIHFTTPPPVLLTKPMGSGNIHPATNVEITFDRLMDQAATEAAFQITPTLTGAFEWRETTLIFEPDGGYLAQDTTYSVTIDAAALDTDGQPVLDEPYTWSFQTGQMRNIANFGEGPNAQVIDADGRRAIQFQFSSSATAPIVFELHRLSLEQFLDRYSSGFKTLSGYKDPLISTQGAALAMRWQFTPSRQSKGWDVQETLIPADVPPGMYVLNMSAGHLNGQLLVLLTRHVVVLKQAEGQVVAWVSDINGGSIADMEVVVYARNGELISQGRTDANGVYRAQVNRDTQPLIVIARKDDDITATGLSNEWISRNGQWWGWWQPTPQAKKYAAYIYTERPIYRPGQTVFFKSIIRTDADAVLGVLPGGTPVTVRIRDARNNVVRTFKLATNALGTLNGEFHLAEGAMLGEYAVELNIEGETHRQVFKVQDYRKPDYAVSVASGVPSGRYIAGETVSVTIDSRYFFGEPVPNASLTIKFYELGEPYNYWDGMENRPDTGKYIWYESSKPEIQTKTDTQGRYTFTFKAGLGKQNSDYWYYWQSSLKQTLWGIEATVDDGSHQTVSSFAVVEVFNAAEQLSLDIGGYFHTPGQPFSVRAKVSTILDKPVGGRALRLELRRYNSSDKDYTTVVQSASLTTTAEGQAIAPFTIDKPGFYQLYLSGTDRLGNQLGCEQWVYAFSKASLWESRSGELNIAADRASYAPGELAHLAIESSFSGPALLTFERGTTRREQMIELTAPLTFVDIPIQPDDAPNIFVTVNAWRPTEAFAVRYDYSASDSQLRTASVRLSVPVTDKTLNVTLTPNCKGRSPCFFTPREKAAVTVRVTNSRGEPVQAEVSLAMVDEAIFSLSQELAGPIFDAFYSQRSNIVRTYDGMALVRYVGGGRGGGGGGDGFTTGNPRSDFPDTAAWFPVLQTDANGEVVVSLTLPDSLTSWRLTAKAITTNNEVGEALTNIVTKQPIVVRPILPRALTAGDQVELSAMVHNYSDSVTTITVTIQATLLQIHPPPTQTISLNPGELRIVGWQVRAMEAGEAIVTVQAKSGKLSDAVRLPLPIRPLAIPEVTTWVGEFTGTLTTSLDWPGSALSMSTVKIEFSRSIAGTLLTGLEFLTGYPFG